MTTKLLSLPKGFRFPPATFSLSQAEVATYRQAVADQALPRLEAETSGALVPPLAIVARALWAIIECVGLPAGLVHVGQEVAFYHPLRPGEPVECQAHVANHSQHSGWALIIIEMEGQDEAGGTVFSGRSTLSAPLPETETASG